MLEKFLKVNSTIIVTGITSLLTNFIGYIFFILLRSLTEVEFERFNLGLSFFYIIFVSAASLERFLSIKLARLKNDESIGELSQSTIIFAFLFLLFFSILSIPANKFYALKSDILIFMNIAIFIIFANSLLRAVLYNKDKYMLSSISMIIEAVFRVIVLYIFLFLLRSKADIELVTLTPYIIGNIVALLFLIFVTYRSKINIFSKGSGSKLIVKQILKQTFVQFLLSIFFTLDYPLAKNVLKSLEIPYYNGAMTIMKFVILFLIGISYPILFEKEEKLDSTTKKILLFTVAILTGFTVTTSVLPKLVFSLTIGLKYYKPFTLLLFSFYVLVNFIFYIFVQYLIKHKRNVKLLLVIYPLVFISMQFFTNINIYNYVLFLSLGIFLVDIILIMGYNPISLIFYKNEKC